MVNFLKETEEALKENGHTFDDVRWIGTIGCAGFDEEETMPVDLFIKNADFEYDNSYGGVEINSCLVVVGDDWYLERHEYDGSEWWEYKKVPIMPTETTERNIILPRRWRDE